MKRVIVTELFDIDVWEATEDMFLRMFQDGILKGI